jgi:hypothetical protein
LESLLAAVVLSLTSIPALGSPAALERGFKQPPDSARPWVYWFPLDGNLSSNGITLDLEAMARVGIGGVLYMETDQGAPRGPAAFAGPLWRNLFKHICAEAHRLGLEVNMNNDAGWCGSGGPWITPELSMQRVVWTETNIAGPKRLDAVLGQPKAVANFYRDIAVFAYPTPASNYVIPHLNGKSTAAREEITPRAFFPALAADAIIRRDRIVDLSPNLGQNGRLAWDVPAGRWTILRLGHTSTGKDNHPAPLSGRGLECDKLSQEAATVQFDNLMGKLIADNSKLTGQKRTLVSTHIDSWEVGSQNWTPKFRVQFQRLRGYDPLAFLPVMSGRVVESLEISERFLWDVRQTVGDLLIENYAGHFQELARKKGLRLSIEAYDGPCDDMTYAGRADEPMGEFWSYSAYSGADWCTEMASAAHVYGKPILGAEAFTATDAEKWQAHPGMIKAMGDWAFCEGINRFVFHRYALQPWDDRRPGMSMGPWGLHYERGQTWWEQSRAWHEYLARCQYMLQQGLFVADLCFLAPEMSPQRFKSPIKSGRDRLGYNFDGCTPEAVLTRLSVRDGRLVLPDGMSYRVMVLPQVETMTPRLLRKIRDFVQAGATIVGAPPVKSPSLANFPQCDEEVKGLARELWGDGEAPSELTERRVGAGRVFWGGPFRRTQAAPEPAASALGAAKWIWRKEGNPAAAAPPGHRYFRRVVTVDAASPIESARLVMTADNAFECWINGRRAGEGDNFARTYSFPVGSLLKPGANLIAVDALNGTDAPNPAALIGVLTIHYRNGRTDTAPTDGQWQAAATVSGPWTSEAAAAGTWAAALELGPPGMPPWGDIDQALPGSDPIPDINLVTPLLARLGVPPDFAQRTAAAPSVRYIHKTIDKTDVYFVANKNARPETAVCAFRVQGKRPELWRPETGRTEPAAVYSEKDGLTTIPLSFEPAGSVFVVFRARGAADPERVTAIARDGATLVNTEATEAPEIKPGEGRPEMPPVVLTREGKALEALVSEPGAYTLKLANGKTREFNVPAIPPPVEVTGPWSVAFDPKWGGPATAVTFDKLQDWAQRPEAGIRYYSGAAIYRTSFKVSKLDPQVSSFLDLGQVAVAAEVKLNGKPLGILWKAPYRLEVTKALQAGENVLELKVVNLWINRMIGDEQLREDSARNANGTLKEWPQWVQSGQPSPSGRYTFTSWRLWKKDSPLQPSGLIGPVTLRELPRVVVK